MGSRVSYELCERRHGVRPNCDYNSTSSGDFEKGDVPTEPDIAGTGVVYSFIAVTLFSLLASIVMLIWRSYTAFRFRASKIPEHVEPQDLAAKKYDVARICDKLIATCSDQQIVVGSAYLWSVHESSGCSMSFYHLMVVSNMIVLSCATHLLCIVSLQRYWKNPAIAIVRVAPIFAVIGVAGKLMDSGESYPSKLPNNDEEASAFLLPAPCFMRARAWDRIFNNATEPRLDLPDGGGKILGWRMWLMVVSYSAFAAVVTLLQELLRPPPRDQKKEPRWPRKIVHRRFNVRRWMTKSPRTFAAVNWIYHVVGVAVAAVAIFYSVDAIVRVRMWAHDSEWLETDGDGADSPEQDVDTLGQTLPLFSCALVAFVLIEEAFNELKSWRARRRQGAYVSDPYAFEGASLQGTQDAAIEMSHGHGPSKYDGTEGQQHHQAFQSSASTGAEAQPLRDYEYAHVR